MTYDDAYAEHCAARLAYDDLEAEIKAKQRQLATMRRLLDMQSGALNVLRAQQEEQDTAE